jgi:polysaccharide deactylase WbmS-like protein
MNAIVLTFDIDWAPDFAIDFVAQQLVRHQVRATWFVTHNSPAIERLRQHSDLFELGIHPNFLPGSTHGSTTAEVLDHCMRLVPEAFSVRTHCLFQSTPLLCDVLNLTPIRVDASLYLPHARRLSVNEIQWQGETLLRVPHFWEDDFEIERIAPCWSMAPLLAGNDGLKVFDFHPIHVYLNSSTMNAYRQLKQKAANLSEVSEDQAAAVAEAGAGAQTLFVELTKHLSQATESLRMRDIHERWRQGHFNDQAAPQ